jgi:tryptophan-rich sensory protein
MTLLASRGQLRASYLRWALVCVPATVLLGTLSAALSQSGVGNPWFDALVKPSLYPPPALFGIVWTILYALMGFALAMVLASRGARGRGLALGLFAAQLAINLAWSPVFFGLRQITAALGVIIALDIAVMLTIWAFWKVRPLAAWLLLPYLAWVLFATALTWQFREANPGADGREVSGAAQRIQL